MLAGFLYIPLSYYFFFLFQSDLNIVASFDRRGECVYTGNAKGKVSLKLTELTLINEIFLNTNMYLKIINKNGPALSSG